MIVTEPSTGFWSFLKLTKLDIAKSVNVLTTLSNLKAKVDDLDVGKLQTFPLDLKKLIDVFDK